MDSFQDEINYENRIVPEDRDKLISLLEEYSAKLIKKCDLVGRNRRILNFILISSAIVFFIGITVAVACYSILPPYWSSSLLALWIAFWIVAIFFTDFLFGILSVFFDLISASKNKGVIDSSTHEAHSLAHRLEKLVGIASEFYEHIEKKEISKIELDLKIAEAESVLNYYDSIVGKPKKYSDKKRD
jgi:hypothetical protein